MDNNSQSTQDSQQKPANPRPDERTGLNIDEFVRIHDPQNREILLEKRG